jgi:hypothetical protein
MIDIIKHNDIVFAILIPASHSSPGIEFFTDASYSQQLGFMARPEGYVIPAHVHLPVPRQVTYTQEVLFIRKGIVRVDFYDKHEAHICSRVLEAGDVILLAQGGHGFTMLSDAEIIEVKQGPYTENDKQRFNGSS